MSRGAERVRLPRQSPFLGGSDSSLCFVYDSSDVLGLAVQDMELHGRNAAGLFHRDTGLCGQDHDVEQPMEQCWVYHADR